jgi:hypothetical protein
MVVFLFLFLYLTNHRQLTTADEKGLFRSNSNYAMFLSAFTRLHGHNYLRNLVKHLLGTMAAIPPGTSYEVDPAKVMRQDIMQNLRNVEYVTSVFLGLITSSLPALPGYDFFFCVKKFQDTEYCLEYSEIPLPT